MSLTQGVKRLVARLRRGEALVLTHTVEGEHYSLAVSGRTVRQDVARRAIASGVLAPRQDGLLAETSQTFGVADE